MSSLQARIGRLPNERPLLALLLSILVVEIVGASGSIFTVQSLGSWYDSLVQPAIAPPNWVFGPVWTTLFALMGVAVWLVWQQVDEKPADVRVAMIVFAVHFVFNLGWSAAFFGIRQIGLGLVVIAILWLLIGMTMTAFARVDRRAALLLVPYILWVSFAAFLNYQFWVLN